MEKLILDYLWVVALVVLLALPFKGAALWKAARRGHIWWFLILLVLNTFAILDIIYIFIFSNWGENKKDKQEKQEQENQNIQQARQSQFSSSSKSRTTII
jgi:uncharacterized membrane protein